MNQIEKSMFGVNDEDTEVGEDEVGADVGNEVG